MTLRPLIRWLDIHDDGASEKEEVKARLLAAEAALERIDNLEKEGWVHEDTTERMRDLYGYRRRRFVARHNGAPGDGEEDLEGREARPLFSASAVSSSKPSARRSYASGAKGR